MSDTWNAKDDSTWDAKNVPDHVKVTKSTLAQVVQTQFDITLANMAGNSQSRDTGDGVLAYLHGWCHKRFGGQYCLLYQWQPRRDGKGVFLAVKGIGRKNGNGNDYDAL